MVVVDLDGTLTKSNGKAAHCMGHLTKDEILKVMDPVKIAKLEPRTEIIERVLNFAQDGHYIAIITGRWDYLDAITRCWLETYNVPHHSLWMRYSDDWEQKATVVKLKAFENMLHIISGPEEEVIWIDDDVEMLNVVCDKYPQVNRMLV